jgi:hypothetical protein
MLTKTTIIIIIIIKLTVVTEYENKVIIYRIKFGSFCHRRHNLWLMLAPLLANWVQIPNHQITTHYYYYKHY